MPSRRTTTIARAVRRAKRAIAEAERAIARLAKAARSAEAAANRATAAPKRRAAKISPKRRAALRLQGRYMGYMRQLTATQKKGVHAVKENDGMRAAVAMARRLAKS